MNKSNTYKPHELMLAYMISNDNKDHDAEYTITKFKDAGLINGRVDRDNLIKLVDKKFIAMSVSRSGTENSNQYEMTRIYRLTDTGKRLAQNIFDHMCD